MGFLKDLLSNMKGSQTNGSASDADTGGKKPAAVDGQSKGQRQGQVEFMTDLLKSIGCRLQKDDDYGDNAYVFVYQGEHLLLYTKEETPVIIIYDTHWYDVSLDDLDDFSLLKEAVNECNKGSIMGCVFYDIYKDEGKAVVGSQVRTHIGPYVPDAEDFMRYVLDSLLRKHQQLFHEMEEARNARNKKYAAKS